MTMSAGSATPKEARTMWKPSVKAIWLRAASRFEARGSQTAAGPVSAGMDVVRTSRGGACRGLGQRVRAPVDVCLVGPVEHLRPACPREVGPSPRDERVDAVVPPRHQPR